MEDKYQYEYTEHSSLGHALQILESSNLGNGLHLDIGCGWGRIADPLSSRTNLHYIGVDAASCGLDELTKRGYEVYKHIFGNKQQDIDFLERVIDGRKLASISILDFLEHLAEPETLLEILYIISLKHKALLIASLPNVTHLDVGLKLFFGRFDYTLTGLLDKTHLSFFTEKRIEELFSQCGWHQVIKKDVHIVESDQHFPVDHVAMLPNAAITEYLTRLRSKVDDTQYIFQFVRGFFPKEKRANLPLPVIDSPFLTVLIVAQDDKYSYISAALEALSMQVCNDFEVILFGPESLLIEIRTTILTSLSSELRGRVRCIDASSNSRSVLLNRGCQEAKGKYVSVYSGGTANSAWVLTLKALSNTYAGRLLITRFRNMAVVDLETMNADDTTVNDYDSSLLLSVLKGSLPPLCVAFPRSVHCDFGIHFANELENAHEWDYFIQTMSICGVGVGSGVTVYSNYKEQQIQACIYKQAREVILSRLDSSYTLLPPGWLSRIGMNISRDEDLLNILVKANLNNDADHNIMSSEMQFIYDELCEVKVQLDTASVELESLYKSTSWRITRPLRQGITFLRSITIASTIRDIIQRSLSIIRHQGLGNFILKVLAVLLRHKPQSSQEQVIDKMHVTSLPEAIPHVTAPEIVNIPYPSCWNGINIPTSTQPAVSVIISGWTSAKNVLEFLVSISRHPQKTSFEILILDNTSDDELQRIFEPLSFVRYSRDQAARGRFASGLALAKGEFLYYLLGCVQATENWLDGILEQISADSRVAMVIPKIIDSQGSLMAAGTSVVNDGRFRAAGHGDNPLSKNYCIARRINVPATDVFIIRKTALNGGALLAESSQALIYEVAELGCRIRDAGSEIMYSPESALITCSDIYEHPILSGQGKDKFVESHRDLIAKESNIRFIAFYLPQFHAIPENDEWWGKGFTEWTNVTKAKPNFPGHYQPHLPSDLGFYDLRMPEARIEQALLAEKYGISAFCYYYYWFNGKKLLERPLEEVLKSGKPDFPFCICWPNETWTKKWDGQESHVLIEQTHSHEDDIAFIQSLFPYFRDRRYIHINNKPILLIYRASRLPNPRRTTEIWREEAMRNGIGELYLAYVQTHAECNMLQPPSRLGFDAVVEFPPHCIGVSANPLPRGLDPAFEGSIFDYVKTAEQNLLKTLPNYPFFRCVMPSWDNTARRQHNGSIYLNSSPSHYEQWLDKAVDFTDKFAHGDERIVFINAWNEWAEGNHLEPDRKYGHQFLEATSRIKRKYDKR